MINNDGNILSKKALENKYELTCRQLDYETTIPKTWK